MEIVVGKQYIVTNVMEGYYGRCHDIIALDGQVVKVLSEDTYDSVCGLNNDYKIVDSEGETHYVEAINLKEIE